MIKNDTKQMGLHEQIQLDNSNILWITISIKEMDIKVKVSSNQRKYEKCEN